MFKPDERQLGKPCISKLFDCVFGTPLTLRFQWCTRGGALDLVYVFFDKPLAQEFLNILRKYSTRIKDAGIEICHARGYIVSTLQGFKMGWRGLSSEGRTKLVIPTKKQRFCFWKIYWGRQTEWKTYVGSAGVDNEASWYCKRRVTANLVQNHLKKGRNLKSQGLNFLDPGNPTFSRRRPMPACSPVGFQ